MLAVVSLLWATVALPALSAPVDCKNLKLKVTATVPTIVVPDVGNLSAPGGIETLFAKIPEIASTAPRVTKPRTVELSAVYCPPRKSFAGGKTPVVELLVHGASYTKEYWDQGAWNDPNPIYSWQKFANLQGYATLAVDRYGNGASTRGDPLQDVQLPLEAELLYQVIQKIKAGEISGQKSRVVFVGHSLGSQSGQFLLKSHPDAVDAAILTGLATSSNPEAFNLTLELRNKPARDFVPRFAHLPQGYLVNTVAQVRETLFYSNAYDHSIPAKDFKTRGTLAVGEILDFPSFAVPEYIAPLFVLTGNNDKLFCSPDPKDDCRAGLQGVRPTYFPNSSNFDYFSVPLTGHDLDFHFSAPVAFLKAHEWLKKVLHP